MLDKFMTHGETQQSKLTLLRSEGSRVQSFHRELPLVGFTDLRIVPIDSCPVKVSMKLVSCETGTSRNGAVRE